VQHHASTKQGVRDAAGETRATCFCRAYLRSQRRRVGVPGRSKGSTAWACARQGHGAQMEAVALQQEPGPGIPIAESQLEPLHKSGFSPQDGHIEASALDHLSRYEGPAAAQERALGVAAQERSRRIAAEVQTLARTLEARLRFAGVR